MSSSTAPSQVPKEFDPDITSPVWLTRRLLLAGVRKYADQLTGRLLDFGCGAKPYRSLFRVPEYVGVDFQGDGHDHANEAIDVFYDGKVLPFADASFDSVFSTEVFEHIFNLPEILREIHRVLKPGGRLLITCPFAICEHEAPNDFARYTSFAIRHLLEQHGFEILQQEKLGSAQEALWQMRIVYWNWHVLSLVRNVRGVRTLARVALNVGMNVAAMIADRVLPRAQDLYLNNLVLARKREPRAE